MAARRKKNLDTRIRTKDQQITTVTTTVCRSTGLSYVEMKSAKDFRQLVAHFHVHVVCTSAFLLLRTSVYYNL